MRVGAGLLLLPVLPLLAGCGDRDRGADRDGGEDRRRSTLSRPGDTNTNSNVNRDRFERD